MHLNWNAGEPKLNVCRCGMQNKLVVVLDYENDHKLKWSQVQLDMILYIKFVVAAHLIPFTFKCNAWGESNGMCDGEFNLIWNEFERCTAKLMWTCVKRLW